MSMGKGCDLYGPNRTITRTYERNFIRLTMNRTKNLKSNASLVRVETTANWIQKLKPTVNKKISKNQAK
jgi:hypothetical protein